MKREEILAKSQQENHGQDIVNLEVSKNGMHIGWVVIICRNCGRRNDLWAHEQRSILCHYGFERSHLFLQIYEIASET